MAPSTPPPPPEASSAAASTVPAATRPLLQNPPRPPACHPFYSSPPRLPSNPNPNYPQLAPRPPHPHPQDPAQLLYPVASSGRGLLSRPVALPATRPAQRPPYMFPYMDQGQGNPVFVRPNNLPHMLIGSAPCSAGAGSMPGVVKGIPVPSSHQPKVLVEEKSCVRVFTLNRPKQLNALSAVMVSRLLELFLACAKDSSVKLIILKGKGRAFCAGGDVSAVVRDITRGNWKAGADYFRKEFTMNYVIATYNKPQVSILNGIVMGGGAGVSVHGRFRIATENSLFAMPETGLGLFPDIGASYFLSRLPGFFGEYIGLTGARLDGAEMLACGLATHFVQSEKLPLLEEALVKADSSDPVVISNTIGEFSHVPNLKKNSAYHRLDVINKCFSRRTVEEIIAALERESIDKNDDWISSTIQSLKKASPMSLKISLRSVHLSQHS